MDGVVTDDNDVFLFGGQHVYRHIFDDKQCVGLGLGLSGCDSDSDCDCGCGCGCGGLDC